jgi:thiol-disulfide isomerase/thioredoxin
VKGLRGLASNGKLNIAVALIVLVVLLAIGPLIWRGEAFFSSNPLKQLAIGEMTKFGFKHQGTPAPGVDFEGPDGQMTLARLRGKPVLVNLWASWCGPCVKELPSLDQLQVSMASEGLEVVALNMDQNRDNALAFLEDAHIHHLKLYFDPHLLMSIALQEEGIPVSVLYGADGHEIGRFVGPADWSSEEAKALIRKAIAPQASELVKP